jgi:mannosylglycerate synthase
MSLVVFPFKEEDLSVVGSNLAVAAGHPRVDEVWAVAASPGGTMDAVETLAGELMTGSAVPVRVFAQDRVGRFRHGKGDGMNTAIRRSAEIGFDRVHFYDADITNFDGDWIESAEVIADRGYDIVRHRFPRAATDAMITWMVTRPGLAMIFPGTDLPRLGQPLGGEMLLSGEVVKRLAHDRLVSDRSDWGVDTVITYATATMGLPFYEHLVASGKRHALYGSLDEIRTMLVECLDAVRSLRGLPGPGHGFDSDPPAPAPDDLKQTVAYDLDRTVLLLTEDWSEEEFEVAGGAPRAAEVLRNVERPWFEFMDAKVWGDVLRWLLAGFELGDPAWEGVAFRLWLMRVLAYTTNQATEGYDRAIDYLEETIRQYGAGPGEDDSR